jgi:hypothetical protein
MIAETQADALELAARSFAAHEPLNLGHGQSGDFAIAERVREVEEGMKALAEEFGFEARDT